MSRTQEPTYTPINNAASTPDAPSTSSDALKERDARRLRILQALLAIEEEIEREVCIKQNLAKAKREDPMFYRWLTSVENCPESVLRPAHPEKYAGPPNCFATKIAKNDIPGAYWLYGPPSVWDNGDCSQIFPYHLEKDRSIRHKLADDGINAKDQLNVGCWLVDAQTTKPVGDGEVSNPNTTKTFGPWVVSPAEAYKEAVRNMRWPRRPKALGPKGDFAHYHQLNRRVCGDEDWYRAMSKLERLAFIESDMAEGSQPRLFEAADGEGGAPWRHIQMSEIACACGSDGVNPEID